MRKNCSHCSPTQEESLKKTASNVAKSYVTFFNFQTPNLIELSLSVLGWRDGGGLMAAVSDSDSFA